MGAKLQTGAGLLSAVYKASHCSLAGPSHLWPECIRWWTRQPDASKADTELCEALSGIFTSSAISTISKYASLLPLSTPAVPNEPELTALMQPVARRKLQPSCA